MDHGGILVVPQVQPEYAVLAVIQHLEILDEVIVPQESCDLGLEPRYREVHTPMPRLTRIADAREHVRDWIRHRHYQLAFRTPGISPRSAISRKQIRQTPKRRMNARARPQRLQR
jgi:hypothetical protein